MHEFPLPLVTNIANIWISDFKFTIMYAVFNANGVLAFLTAMGVNESFLALFLLLLLATMGNRVKF